MESVRNDYNISSYAIKAKVQIIYANAKATKAIIRTKQPLRSFLFIVLLLSFFILNIKCRKLSL